MPRNVKRDAIVSATKAKLQSAIAALNRYERSTYDPDAVAHVLAASEEIKRAALFLARTGWVKL